MRNRLWRTVLCIMIVLLLLVGCATTLSTSSRTPFEWITLANSGLSGIDDYTYQAHVETGINENITISTYNFNGKVHSHREYSISGEELDGTILHPALYMDLMNNKNNKIHQIVQPLNMEATENKVKFLVEEESEQATLRWKRLLLQQYEQVKLSSELGKEYLMADTLQQLKELFAQSETELNQILSTLQVESKFNITIDTVNAIPTLIEEYAVLHYVRQDKKLDEYRLSKIQLQY